MTTAEMIGIVVLGLSSLMRALYYVNGAWKDCNGNNVDELC